MEALADRVSEDPALAGRVSAGRGLAETVPAEAVRLRSLSHRWNPNSSSRAFPSQLPFLKSVSNRLPASRGLSAAFPSVCAEFARAFAWEGDVGSQIRGRMPCRFGYFSRCFRRSGLDRRHKLPHAQIIHMEQNLFGEKGSARLTPSITGTAL